MNSPRRPVRIGVVVLAVLMTFSACGSDKTSPEPKNPHGENATTAKPTTTTTTATTVPETRFETFSRGVDKTNYDDVPIWHGKIDGVECIRYGDHFMCKGFPPA